MSIELNSLVNKAFDLVDSAARSGLTNVNIPADLGKALVTDAVTNGWNLKYASLCPICWLESRYCSATFWLREEGVVAEIISKNVPPDPPVERLPL